MWACNVLWLISLLPGYLRFRIALGAPRREQERMLRRLLRMKKLTEYGREQGLGNGESYAAFSDVPLTEYTDYATSVARIKDGALRVLTTDPVQALEPTSGSSSDPKHIPYTPALQAEFNRAIAPWVADLYMRHPCLLGGKQYWSISPNVSVSGAAGSAVRVGFADDTEYLGPIGRWVSERILCAPSTLSRVDDPEAFEYLTLLFLLRERDLRLISIWHPTFFTVLLDRAPRHAACIADDIESGSLNAALTLTPELRREFENELIPDPDRADFLRSLDFANHGAGGQLWPDLAVISCWTQGAAARWIEGLRRRFPGVSIHEKGLLATEGVVSIPFGPTGLCPCAVRSHFLEFVDCKTGKVHPLWDLQVGRRYSVLLTTGGGLTRYRLHDLVDVTGMLRKTPCVRFIGRDNRVSDLVGEKLHETHVADVLDALSSDFANSPEFLFLAPRVDSSPPCYTLYLEPRNGANQDDVRWAEGIDVALRSNPYYDQARRAGQLGEVQVFRIKKDGARNYRDRYVANGMSAGDVKAPTLDLDVGWETVFEGDYV